MSSTEHLACMAYQMFKPEPEKILDTDQPFAMYSYDRIVRLVLTGMIENMHHRGFSKECIIDILQSKQVRWMLDSREEELVRIGYTLAEDFKEDF